MHKMRPKLIVSLLILSLIGCTNRQDANSDVVFQTLSNQILTNSSLISTVEPFSFETVVEETVLAKQKTIYRDPEDTSDGLYWIANKVSNGSPKKELNYYRLTYDALGNLISKTLIPESTEIVEAEATVYEYYGEPEIGSVFFPTNIWRYGSDCAGCYADAEGYAGTSSGIAIGTHSVRQADGTWEDGITYEGYYIVASSTKLPLCTIVEISNHSFSGEGLEPGVSFKAIIADRGVPENTLDLFVGSETNLSLVRMTSKQSPKVTIIGFGTKTTNSEGQSICSVD
ncbi:MAG: hypothetical protein VB012_04545 [Erysipelotrichaceae bacterium]|nr:hypothetical protein [Erysipelotrichaceae bacterium]